MELSYDQYPSLALQVENTPAEHSDPFDLVADAEEEIVNTYSINLQGNIMNAMENAITPVKNDITVRRVEPGVSVQFFDLLDFVDSHCHHPRLKQFMTSSLAGVFDMHIIGLARNTYFNLFNKFKQEGDVQGIDAYNDFKAAFTDNLWSMDNQNTTFADLIACLSARHLFHDEAGAAHITSDARPFYKERSFDELVLDNRPRELGADTVRKMEEIAAAISPDNKETALKALRINAAAQQENSAKLSKDIAPLLLAIISEAERSASEETEFYALPQMTQKYMVERAQEKFNTAMEKLAGYSSIKVAEFTGIITDCMNGQKELSEVIAKRWPDSDTPSAAAGVAMTRAERRRKAEAAASEA